MVQKKIGEQTLIYGRKKTFSGHFFSEVALSDEQVGQKIWKKRREKLSEKLDEENWAQRYEGVPRTDGRKSSNLPSNTNLV